jgi:hypothetical protein
MGSTSQVTIDIQEAKDIAFVRAHKGMVHVSDPQALSAFTDGRGVFDVDLHCRKLEAFMANHKLHYRIDSEGLLPGGRPVYYGRALWIKRSPRLPNAVA